MAGTNAGAIRGVLCWAQALSVFRSCVVVELLPALYACRLLSLMVVEWCCGGLPPPGKGPSPAVWGEGLYRLSLRRRLRARLCGVQSSRTSRPRVPAGILASWWSCRGRPCSSAWRWRVWCCGGLPPPGNGLAPGCFGGAGRCRL